MKLKWNLGFQLLQWIKLKSNLGFQYLVDEIEKKLMSNLGEQTIQGDAKSTSISILSEIHQTDWGKQFNELSTTLF